MSAAGVLNTVSGLGEPCRHAARLGAPSGVQPAAILHVNPWGGTVSPGSQQWNAIEKGRTGKAWSHPSL